MKTRHMTVLLAAVALLAACEKQVDIDIEAQSPKVMVRAIGQTDSALTVRLTYSRPVFSTFYVANGASYFEEIDDATVTLTVDGHEVAAPTREGGNYRFAHHPQSGQRLTLGIAVPGHEAVRAETTVPDMPTVSGAASTLDETDDQGDTRRTVTFTLDDQQATADYYSVRVRAHMKRFFSNRTFDDPETVTGYDTIESDRYIDFQCVDMTVISGAGIEAMDPEDPEAANTFWGDEMLFTDANINGMNHQFKLQLYNIIGYDIDYPYTPGEPYNVYHSIDSIAAEIYLEVSTLPRDGYMYLKSIESYDGDEMLSLFAEPVQIHSNISGGLGIMTVSARRTVALSPFNVSYR